MEGQKIVIKRIKKVVHEGGGHGGSSWKVAYADFVTAMMAFFLLLWLLSMTSGEKRARLSAYFKNFSVFESGGSAVLDASSRTISGTAMIQQPVDVGKIIKDPPKDVLCASGPGESVPPGNEQASREEVMQKIIDDVSSKLKDVKDQVLVEAMEGGIRIQLVDKESSQMFAIGSSELAPKAKEILKVICDNIRNRNAKFAIEGHTDARPYPSDHYTNWELSTERASTARKELERYGITVDRILKITGYADTQPLIKENPYDTRNRRISLLLIDTNPAGVSPHSPQGAPPSEQTQPPPSP
jgi:chemotaxis protein MotB